jgi:transglutaminase-like putative cysteine protease
MSAPSDLAPGPILPARVRRVLAGPAEGWLTLIFVVLMALTVAWSLDDAAWVLSERTWGDFYASAAILATLLAFVGAKARWPRWLSHLIGAGAAAIIVPLMVGSVLLPDGGSPGELYRATATSMVNAWVDLGVLRGSTTIETGHHLLAIGLIVWSVGQFAGYAVFGHRRPLDAVIVVGLLLLGNISLTANDQLPFLVIFSVAALGVLARAHAFEEQTAWMRRRIGDAAAVRSLYLRGGTAFILMAVFGSLVLTASASSDPLKGAWDDVNDRLIEVSQRIQRFMPFGGNPRPAGFGFGDTAVITGSWSTDRIPAAVIQLPPDEDEEFYWRAVVFDRFDINAWTWSEANDLERASEEPMLAGVADDPTRLQGRREITFTVTPDRRSVFALSPADPERINQASELVSVGQGGYFGAVKLSDAERAYAVAALVPVEGDVPGGITANRLRAAGKTYPAEIRSRYILPIPQGAIGIAAAELLEIVRARAGSDNPYDLALAMERYLQSSNFTYNPDVRGLTGCAELGAVECFARFKQGYCLHYASTMAILLRQAGIPTRLAEGFLPAPRSASGREQLRSSGAHAWVEVYFPTYGWVRFDPTGGGVGQPSTIPIGSPVPSVDPSIDPNFTFAPERSERAPNQGGPTTPSPRGGAGAGNNSGLLIAVAVVLLVGMAAVAFLAWERGPRGDVSADSVWRGIARTAGRFGFGPRPNQTVYEYAGTLGDVLPASRPELQTVATAKVEVAYGRRNLGDDGIRSLKDAHRRLRVALLRLAFRRKERRARRGK